MEQINNNLYKRFTEAVLDLGRATRELDQTIAEVRAMYESLVDYAGSKSASNEEKANIAQLMMTVMMNVPTLTEALCNSMAAFTTLATYTSVAGAVEGMVDGIGIASSTIEPSPAWPNMSVEDVRTHALAIGNMMYSAVRSDPSNPAAFRDVSLEVNRMSSEFAMKVRRELYGKL